MTLCHARNRVVNGRSATRCLANAAQHLRGARDSKLSPRQRYEYAYGAARQCARALAGAGNDRSGSDERHLREAIDLLLKGLALAPNMGRSATAWLQYRREGRLEAPEPSLEVVQRATSWAAILHAYTVKRLTTGV